MICGYPGTRVSGTRILSALVNVRSHWTLVFLPMGLYVARLSADITQDFCRIAAFGMQANRRAVRGSLDLDVSIAAGTSCGQAAGNVPLDDLSVSVRG